MDIEHFLKNSLNAEKEAWAVTEALAQLAGRGEAAALHEEYAQDLTAMEGRAQTIAQMVSAVPYPDVRQVLAARYMHKMPWADIEAALHTSKTTVHRLHKRGVEWLKENYSIK